MIAAFVFFLVSFFCGQALVGKLRFACSPIVHILLSLILGVSALCGILFITSWIIPMTSLWLVGELSIIGVVSIWLGRTESLRLMISSGSSIKSWSKKEKLLTGMLILLTVWFFGRSLFYDVQGQLWAGDRLVWTDWPIHIAIASNFAWGQNVPPQNPTFAGITLVYPFFADFLSGVLMVLGADIPAAFALPGVVLTLVFFGVFVKCGGDLLRQSQLFKEIRSYRTVAMGALFISLFWGGLGWIYWLSEAFSKTPDVFQALAKPAREYTFWAEKGLWFFTFLYSEILPQRAFLFGLPLFFTILLLVKRGWQTHSKKHIFIAGLIGGSMPFFHTHSFISLWILSLSMTGIYLIGHLGRLQSLKNVTQKTLMIFSFFVPFGLLSAIQLPLFLQQSHSIRFNFGWMKESENFFWFWFKNTGFFIPLYLLGLWKGKFDTFGKLIGIAGWSLFLLPNLFLFAAWGYDNLKILTFWYLIGSFFVIAGLVWISRLGRLGKLGAIMLFLSLTLSGVIEVGRLLPTDQVKVALWSPADQELAVAIRQKTPPDSVFLTAAVHDHPVASLAGRKIVIGYPGNSWSWGIQGWDTREQDVHTMFRGGTDALHLWKKYGINYIVVGNRERWFENDLNEDFIQQESELLLEHANTKVYKLN